jgi:hypothetical protein
MDPSLTPNEQTDLDSNAAFQGKYLYTIASLR